MRLQQDLERVQSAGALQVLLFLLLLLLLLLLILLFLNINFQRLSERNCVEIVMKLLEMKLLDVVFTTDGKQYLTPQVSKMSKMMN